MKALFTALILAASVAAAHAADEAKKPNSQQNKMAECQKTAGDQKLEGQARKDFVNNCLKAKPEAASQSQGQKLGACSKEAAAKGLKGDERNKYLSECASK